MPTRPGIELKGMIGFEYLDKFRHLLPIRKQAAGRAKSRKLETVYFDTPDHKLRQMGLTLRVRKIGSTYVQRVRQSDKRLGSISVLAEWEGPVPSRNPIISGIGDKKFRRLLRRAGVERLQPIFRTNVQRSTRALKFVRWYPSGFPL